MSFKSLNHDYFLPPTCVIKTHISAVVFQLVMHFLYKGGCQQLSVGQTDVLELMAAANFFQLDRLLRFCEARCAKLVDLDNIVSMYIHAKVRSRLTQVHNAVRIRG